MSAWSLVLLVALLTASACFRDGGLADAEPAAAPGPLHVRDREGVSYAAWAAPRDLVLALSPLRRAQPPHRVGAATTVDAALLLLRGQFDASLAPRLVSARKTVAVADYTTAIDVVRVGDELRAQPRDALAPGADYTLFWLAAESPAAYPIHVSPAAALGARLVETWPSQLAIAPPNMVRALLRFDGDLADTLGTHVALYETGQDVDDEPATRLALPVRIEAVRCALLGFAEEGDCAWLVPASPLQAGRAHTLSLDATLHTRTGAPIAARQTEFTVASEPDHDAPRFVPHPCALDEQTTADVCTRLDGTRLLVHGALDESALLTLSSVVREGVQVVSALSYANAFELALDVSFALSSLRSPEAGAAELGTVGVVLRARDLAGNERELPISFGPTPTSAAVVIDEVLADPRGKEPAQEWVELLNSALTPSSLMGFTLSTDLAARGRVLTGAVVLAPHERALLVSPTFDPHDLADGALPAGLRLVSLDGPLSLSNGAANLYLRDGQGRRISTAKLLPALFEGQCCARVPASSNSEDPSFALDPAGRCTPGSATLQSSTSSGPSPTRP